MEASTECRSDAVDLADAHMQVKTLSQFHLDGGARCLRSLPRLFFKKGACGSTQFAGMTMPSISQGSLTEQSIALEEPVGRRLTDVQAGDCSRCLPGLPLLHPGYQLHAGFKGLLFLHRFPFSVEGLLLFGFPLVFA